MESARYLCLSLATQQNHTHSHRRCRSWGWILATKQATFPWYTLTVPDTLDQITQCYSQCRGVRPACETISVSQATLSKMTPGFESCRTALGFHSKLFPPARQAVTQHKHLPNICMHLHMPGNWNFLRKGVREKPHTGSGWINGVQGIKEAGKADVSNQVLQP